ncbi:unnamed protein product [Protopolystoma xenopodis]|uniref:Uncharacterized protein n=1 Tax=Protopolystoma xenopodis TaxID=117903 RepID=A0A448WFK2_9PLAT|nr:unnamed protein product [Protopolystoma xenopodis]
MVQTNTNSPSTSVATNTAGVAQAADGTRGVGTREATAITTATTAATAITQDMRTAIATRAAISTERCKTAAGRAREALLAERLRDWLNDGEDRR